MNIILGLTQDRAIRTSLRAALPKTDLVLFESTVDDALRRLVSLQADLVIVDDEPRLGVDAVRSLIEGLPMSPGLGAQPQVVILTGKGDPEAIAAFTSAGASECLLKPFQCDDLQDIVDRCTSTPTASSNRSVAPVHGTDSNPEWIGQHQMALRWMSRNSAYLEDPVRLCQSLVEAIVDIYAAARAAVLISGEDGVRVKASHGLSSALTDDIELSYSSGLMRRFEEYPTLIDREDATVQPDALKELQVFGARLALPLLSSGRVCGAVLIGEKSTGGAYMQPERDLLAVMTRCVSSYLEKSRSYRDMTRQRSRLDLVLANLTSGVVTVSPQHKITMVNARAEQLLEIHATDVLGQSVMRIGSAFADVVLRALELGSPIRDEETYDAATRATLSLTVTPVEAEGAVIVFSRAEKDVTAEGGVPDPLAHSDYNPIWEYLSTRVAQEIKNPMVAISTFAQLLPQRYDSEEFRGEFSSVVQDEINRINGVVETLFRFGRHPRLSLQNTDLNACTREVVDTFEDELRARSINVDAAFEGEDLTVQLDPILFSQAVHNIVRNSIEAMPEGGTLHVQTSLKDGNYELSIRDDGPGIEKENSERVFAPFFSTKENGMGLGLTMAARIVREHSGTIATSQDDDGGAVTIQLPAQPSS